jgi:hypothetical protein
MNLKKNATSKLQQFEHQLNPQKPEEGSTAVKIIGYGEMSTVIKFDDPDLEGYAFKRMPIFRNADEVKKYNEDYKEYNEVLQGLGIKVPEYGSLSISGKNNKIVLYLFQKLIPSHCIINKIIHHVDENYSILIFKEILNILRNIYTHNKNAEENQNLIQIGFDCQLSNWADLNYHPGKKNPGKLSLLFFDTSTPLLRKSGKEQIDPELFLRICPQSLVWIIRYFFLADVLNRYYDIRLTIIDLIANLFKEKKEDLIEPFIDISNQFLKQILPDFLPITMKEIRSYYREDALIWKLFLAFRKIERFIRLKLRKSYDIILPDKIER